MFWIFGGGLAIGSPDGYDGSALATQGQTIVVTVNYRLNIFGFLLNADLKHNGREYGNFGLLDQQLGMKWVQENIAKFGGDPNNITIFGESGGSHGVGGHLVSPYAKGLFQRAIQQSGTVDFVHSPYSQAVTRGKNFAKAVGCASGTAAENAKCLRSLPAATVQANAGAGGGALPLVDGEVIPIEPTIAFAKGRFNKVPIMTGGNRDEYAYVLSSRPTAPTETDFLNYLRNRFQVQGAGPGGLPPAYPANTVDRILAEYPASAYPSVYERYLAAITDGGWQISVCALRHQTRVISSQVPVYHYELRDRTLPYPQPVADWIKGRTGTYHTLDLPYLFPGYTGLAGLDPGVGKFNAEQQKLSNEMIRLWTNFARTGNPNGKGNGPWPRYEYKGWGAKPKIYALDVKSGGGNRSLPDAAFVKEHHCNFWDDLLKYVPDETVTSAAH